MRTLTHVVLPIAILMGVVGVVAYITQNTERSAAKPSAAPSNITRAEPPLELLSFFGEQLPALNEDQLGERRPEEIEHPSTNHKDYLFCSKQPNDFRLSHIKNCKCSTVQIGTVGMSDDELAALDAHPSLTGFCQLVGAMNSMTFAPLPEGEDNQVAGTIIHGSPSGKLKRPYVLRVLWESKSEFDPNAKPDTVHIKLFARAESSAAPAKTDIYIKYFVVLAAGFYPPAIDMGELTTGGSRSVKCYVLSGTRDRLALKMQLSGADGPETSEPCAEISPFVELTPQELEKLPAMLGEKFQSAVFRCAYRYTITLHEQRGKNFLELGPLTRRLTVHFGITPEEYEAKLPVSVLVRGGVRLLNGDAGDRIPLGVFKSDRGTATIVRLRADDPKLDIAVDHTSDPKIKATLRPPVMTDGGKEWELYLEVEPNALVGDLPRTTVVLLKTVGSKPRRMRLPLTGTAER